MSVVSTAQSLRALEALGAQPGDHVRLRYSTLNLSGRVAEITPEFVFVEIPADGGAFHRIGIDAKLAPRLERA